MVRVTVLKFAGAFVTNTFFLIRDFHCNKAALVQWLITCRKKKWRTLDQLFPKQKVLRSIKPSSQCFSRTSVHWVTYAPLSRRSILMGVLFRIQNLTGTRSILVLFFFTLKLVLMLSLHLSHCYKNRYQRAKTLS